MILLFYFLNLNNSTSDDEYHLNIIRNLKSRINENNKLLNNLKNTCDGYETSIKYTRAEYDFLKSKLETIKKDSPDDKNAILQLESELKPKKTTLKRFIMKFLK